MFSKWINEFKTITQKGRFISKLGTFVIALFTLLNIYGFGRVLYFNNIGLDQVFGNIRNEPHFFISFAFQISILLVFTTRFTLNFFNQSKIFWMNQILWLIGFSLFIALWDYSRPKSAIEAAIFHRGTFANFSRQFDAVAILYLFLSPIWRVIVAIISFVKSLKRNV